jgi:hypothetical protein
MQKLINISHSPNYTSFNYKPNIKEREVYIHTMVISVLLKSEIPTMEWIHSWWTSEFFGSHQIKVLKKRKTRKGREKKIEIKWSKYNYKWVCVLAVSSNGYCKNA